MTSGRPAQFSAASPARFGISAKLQLAFGVVAGLTVFATAVAFLSFSAVERGFERIANRQVPVMTNAMRLAIISGDISAAAARYISARSPEDQKATLALIARERSELAAVLGQLKTAQGGHSPALTKFVSLSERLESNLTALEEAISERTQIRAQIDGMLDTMHRVHAEIIDQLTSLSDPRRALEIAARAHLLVSLIGEGSIVRDPAVFKPMQDRLKAAVEALNAATASLPHHEMRAAVSQLVAFGQGVESVFARRARELFITTRVDGTIDENVTIQRDLDATAAALVSDAEADMMQRTQSLSGDLDRSRTLLLSLAVASLLAAGGIGFFYVRRKLVHRLTGVSRAMRRLSSGDVDINVPALVDRDEIGEMARSLEVFRAGEIERRKLSDRERADQVSARERAAAIDQIIGDFRAAVTTIIHTVSDNVARMEATARTLSAVAHEADQQARAVSDSSETTSANVQTVAGAAEQLEDSIREINAQAGQAHEFVRRATDVARAADQMVGQLSAGANRIGDVVMLIRDIAEQTNLLALNATIEAARAGDAGRGFAVVAAEVKALASQTAGATEDIATQIGAIQASTREAVAAIRSISKVMDDINGFTAAVASAVDQQASSTQMIATSVQQAALGANELAGNMIVVTKAMDETNRAASEVLQASQSFSAQASTLEDAVEVFLKRVTAA